MSNNESIQIRELARSRLISPDGNIIFEGPNYRNTENTDE